MALNFPSTPSLGDTYTYGGKTYVFTATGVWRVLAADVFPIESFCLACSDEATLLTTGVAKLTWRTPYPFYITEVRASVTEAATGASLLTVDVNDGGVSILSTKLTFDASETTTKTATTPCVISDRNLADDAEVTIDIDQVGSTLAGKGLKVTIIGYKPS